MIFQRDDFCMKIVDFSKSCSRPSESITFEGQVPIWRGSGPAKTAKRRSRGEKKTRKKNKAKF